MHLHAFLPADLSLPCDLQAVTLGRGPRVERRLSDLRGCFRDAAAYEAALAQGNPLLYAVASFEKPTGAGQLHYGLGVLYPGMVGDEYFLTKGHYHSRREAAEVYVGLAGEGLMLLEDESGETLRAVPLGAGKVVYVPGHTAHRTVNTGRAPLAYIGVYPSDAGHDYGSIAKNNFRQVVVESNGRAEVRRR